MKERGGGGGGFEGVVDLPSISAKLKHYIPSSDTGWSVNGAHLCVEGGGGGGSGGGSPKAPTLPQVTEDSHTVQMRQSVHSHTTAAHHRILP